MEDSARDIVQLLVWAIIGLFITWGIFLAFVGFRREPAYSRRRIARLASYASLFLGIFWIMLWVSAVVYNVLEIIGVPVWLS